MKFAKNQKKADSSSNQRKPDSAPVPKVRSKPIQYAPIRRIRSKSCDLALTFHQIPALPRNQ